MNRILNNNLFVFILLLIFWISVGIILLFIDKASIHLFLNQFHSPFFDHFFKHITNLGDGLAPVFISLLFAFISVRKTIIIGITGITGGLLAQLLKRVVFSDSLRPKAYFQGIAELYFVPGVEVHSYHSFPSGHTTTTFGLAICLIFFTKDKSLKLVYFLAAISVGYSRIYLSQHFLVDVYFGSILGVLISVFCIQYFISLKNNKIDYPLTKLLVNNK